MANLTEDGSAWEAGIYQLEQDDAADAGTGGNGLANLQPLQLANRTAYLKSHMDALEVLRDRGPVVRSQLTLSANTTLVRATHMGVLLEASGYTLTMPVSTGLLEGDIFPFTAGLTGNLTITKNTSQTIPDAVLYGFAVDTMVLKPGEKLTLIWKAGVWKILSYTQFSISSPIGSVVAMASSTVPTGWIKCNGASLDRTAYARLFAVIGSTYGAVDGSHFTLPDLRGEFIRGWDDARLVDTGRAIGSAQSDLLAAHVHRQAASSDLTGTSGGSGRYADTNVSYPSNGVASNLQTASTGGAETRPRNVAMMYCIKY